jgi:O-antigen ligase
VFLLAAPMTAWFILNSRQPAQLLKLIFGAYVLLAMLSAGLQLADFGSGDIFHQREHFVIPVLGVVVYFFRGVLAKILGIAVIVVIAVAASKITAYITGLATVTLLLLTQMSWMLSNQTNPIKSALAKILAASGFALSLVGLYLLYSRLDTLLPSGNTRYRLHMYELAFDKFLDSPIWGVGFSQSAVTHFDLFQVALATQNLPTHSDPLDIAANGGVIGLGLWLFGLLSVLWPAWSQGGSYFGLKSDGRMIRTFYGFLMLTLTGVLVSLFNPILNLPNQAWAFWASLGALAAFARLEVNAIDSRDGLISGTGVERVR